MKGLQDRWGLSANALKARAKALHEWLWQGHAMSLLPAVQEAQGGRASLMRQSPASDKSVGALVPIRQRMQELRQEDPLTLARHFVDAADLGVPLTNREMAKVLGVGSISKDRNGCSPHPGFTLHPSEHNGNPFWTVVH